MDIKTQLILILFSIGYGIVLSFFGNILFNNNNVIKILRDLFIFLILCILYCLILYMICFNKFSTYIIGITFFSYFIFNKFVNNLIVYVKKLFFTCKSKIKMLYCK